MPAQTPPAEAAPDTGSQPDEAQSPPPATAVEPTVEANEAVVAGLGDVLCPLAVEIGNGTLTVREVIELRRSTILPMKQPAGHDLNLIVNGVTLAQGEVVIVEDSTAIRVTEIARGPGADTEGQA